jgi:hypothetical protein
MGQPGMKDAGEASPPRDKSLGDRPTMALLGMIHGYWNSQVVRAAADLRLADHLADGPRTAEEVADLESSDPHATYRLMRACAGLGLLASDGDGRFSVTPAGALLQSGVPGSLRDHALAFGAPGHWLPWGQLCLRPSARAARRRPRCSAPACSTTWPGSRRRRPSSPPRCRH